MKNKNNTILKLNKEQATPGKKGKEKETKTIKTVIYLSHNVFAM